MLTSAALKRSREFIESQGRPLEAARFRFAFEGGSAAAVVEALSAFQNADGGFGHGLEPDLRTPDSSALCTSVAFQVLRSVRASSGSPVVVRGLMYLMDTLDADHNHWPIIPASAQASPHAPWWTESDPAVAMDFSLNPTAEILGYLYEHPSHVQSAAVEAVTEQVLSSVVAADQMVMHDLLCCLRLYSTPGLPAGVREAIEPKLEQLVCSTVAREPEQWEGYSLRPLQAVDGPHSPFIAGLETHVTANLDYEIASQNPDGSWSPTWDWGGANPEAWTQARQEWAGVITLEKLLALNAFGRIEGLA
jgi:hypothetical protein